MMKISKNLLLTNLLTLPLSLISSANPDDAQQPKADELKAEYAASKRAYDVVEKPKLGEENFREDLQIWSDANTRKQQAAKALTPFLIKKASTQAEAEFKTTKAELREIHFDLVGSIKQVRKESQRKALSFFAEIILPEVRDKELAEDRAEFFAELSEPNNMIRNDDELIKKGTKLEPNGWIVQDVYALALARTKKFDDAKAENDLLLMKVSSLLPSKYKINHGGNVRTIESLHREFIMHRALMESLSGNKEAAKLRLAEATAIQETNADILAIQKTMEKEILK